MFRFLTLSALVGALLPMSASATPTIAEYAARPDFSAADLSPDGQKLSVIHVIDGQEYLCVFQIADQSEHCHANVRALRANATGFVDDEHVLVLASERTRVFGSRGRFDQVTPFVVNIRRDDVDTLVRDVRAMHPRQAGLTGIIGYSEDGDSVFVPSYNNSRPLTYDVFSVDLDSGRGRRTARGTGDTIGWVVDSEGHGIARENYEMEGGRYWIEVPAGEGEWRTIFSTTETLRTYIMQGLSADRSSLVFIRPTADESAEGIVYLNLRTGEFTGPVHVLDGREIEGLMFNRDRELEGIRYSGMRPAYHFEDASIQAAMDALMERFQGTNISYSGRSEDSSRILVNVSGRYFSGVYVVYDIPSQSVVMAVPQRRTITPEDMALIETIQYQSSDGLPINAVITWPAGIDIDNSPNMPLIVMPHGGPEAYDRMGYDWLAQSIANQGYLVFQPNFRGSDGFGRAFTQAGRGEWGGKMQDDVTEGLQILIDEGWADPNRVCIVGWSYGGYAALAGGAFTPERYQCVVSVAGVSDLYRMLQYEDRRYGQDSMPYRYWVDQFGRDGVEQEDLEPRSAYYHADAFQAPVLLLHGDDDLIVPVEQSEVMAEALREAGRDVTLHTFPEQNHSIMDEEHREAVLNEIIGFVNQHIGGR